MSAIRSRYSLRPMRQSFIFTRSHRLQTPGPIILLELPGSEEAVHSQIMPLSDSRSRVKVYPDTQVILDIQVIAVYPVTLDTLV